MMQETDFGLALKELLVREMYESQCDKDRKMMMLATLAAAMGFTITLAYDGDRSDIKRGLKVAREMIGKFASYAVDNFPEGKPLK